LVKATQWQQRVVELVLVKQRLHEVDVNGLWAYNLPAVAATPTELDEVEKRIGEPLDRSYRDFLLTSGGWRAFYQTIDLFGPQDLLGGPRLQHAMDMLVPLEPVLVDLSLTQRDVLPIGCTLEDRDLFVMTRRTTKTPGAVLWLAGTLIDRYPDFDEFFAAMVDYNRLEIQELEKTLLDRNRS
jgi:hypothetical protein